MKAAVLYAPNQIEIRQVPTPVATDASEVIAEVKFVGVCKTDQQLTATGVNQALILGHEVVCKHAEQQGYFALNNEISCGKCSYCQEQLTSHCLNLQELGINQHGGYAEKICVPTSNLYAFDLQNSALGVLIEPLSCAVRGVTRILAAINLLSVTQPNVLMIGGGLSGALLSYLLSHAPTFAGHIKLYDIASLSIPWASQLGIERVTIPELNNTHLVIECSGSPAGLATAFRIVRNAGIVCIYGVPQPDVALPLSAHELFMREIAVITSFAGATDKTMRAAINHIQQDEVFFTQLLGRFIPLEKLPVELTAWNPQSGTRTVVDLNA